MEKSLSKEPALRYIRGSVAEWCRYCQEKLVFIRILSREWKHQDSVVKSKIIFFASFGMIFNTHTAPNTYIQHFISFLCYTRLHSKQRKRYFFQWSIFLCNFIVLCCPSACSFQVKRMLLVLKISAYYNL